MGALLGFFLNMLVYGTAGLGLGSGLLLGPACACGLGWGGSHWGSHWVFVLHLLGSVRIYRWDQFGSVRICRWDPFVPSHPAQGCHQGYLVTGDFRLVRGRRLHLIPQCRFPMCSDLWPLLGHSVGDLLFQAAFHRLGHGWE